ASSARLVITAETCGRSSRPRKVAPPLKSTRTKLRISDECVMDSPSTSVRSSSDLPDPVAPMSSPCGPMPPLRGLLDVQFDRCAAFGDADRDAEPVPGQARAGLLGLRRIPRLQIVDAEQLG